MVKIDTKEKFHVITLIEPNLSANLAATFSEILTKYIDHQIKNVILNLAGLFEIDDTSATVLWQVQQKFYEQNASFVICEIQTGIEQKLEDMDLLELMNITPTESEAWDIVQMEEIERELMDGPDDFFLNEHE